MGKIPRIRLGKCPASLLPRRTGTNAAGMVTLQVKAEEVWTATDEGNRFNLLLR